MRITIMQRVGKGRVAIVTDQLGTIVRNEPDDGQVLATFGGDRHDEIVADYQRRGWAIAQ